MCQHVNSYVFVSIDLWKKVTRSERRVQDIRSYVFTLGIYHAGKKIKYKLKKWDTFMTLCMAKYLCTCRFMRSLPSSRSCCWCRCRFCAQCICCCLVFDFGFTMSSLSVCWVHKIYNTLFGILLAICCYVYILEWALNTNTCFNLEKQKACGLAECVHASVCMCASDLRKKSRFRVGILLLVAYASVFIGPQP